MTSIWQQINQANAAVVEQVGQSVVRIYSGEDGIGAGMVWHADGVIVTNAHVVADKNGQRNNLVVALADGKWHGALVIGYDLQKDVAIIRIDADNLTSITPQMDVLLQPGHYVLALGHPWGVHGAVSGGVVIGVGAGWPELPQPQRGRLLRGAGRLRAGQQWQGQGQLSLRRRTARLAGGH